MRDHTHRVSNVGTSRLASALELLRGPPQGVPKVRPSGPRKKFVGLLCAGGNLEGVAEGLRRGAPTGGARVPLIVSLGLTFLRWNISTPSGKARVVMFSNNEPWFVAKVVVDGLGLSAAGITVHMGRLKREQKQKLRYDQSSTLVGLGLLQNIWLISRGGFNDLILESRKPVAREYRQWVTDKVLPALQDTGTFTDEGHP